MDQRKAPVYEALQEFRRNRVVPFDVPGHKRGRGNPELVALLGKQCVELDVNSMKPLDNLCHPISVIKEAEELAAEAFGAAHAFLMVGGTTSAVQTMVLTACKSGEKIILPRNVHRSVINALVVNGATPIYVNPDTDSRLGIALGMKISQVERAIEENPEAKAILVNNPTYYGICSNLKKIVELAHEHGMMVLVDEAHGTHFYFGEDMTLTAMAAGADMSSVSMHKSGGSLTQSSFLLTGPDVSAGYVRQVINLTQTTSASYLLISSLDISRRNLALRGKELFREVMRIANYARTEINKIGGYYAYGKELINGDSVFDFDPTKLTVYTLDIGLAGIEVYDLLRDEYDIQLELGKDRTGLFDHEYINPSVVMTPQEAFYAPKEEMIPIRETNGRICTEFVMCYPPGIPILAPGERITQEIIDYILYAKEKGCQLTGPEDEKVERLNVIKESTTY